MQPFAELTSWIAGVAPLAQEFYLFCFFCLGFAIFRTEAVKRVVFVLGGGSGRKAKAASGLSSTSECCVEKLRADFEQHRYEQVLDSWGTLGTYTGEALTLVVSALLALGRPEDVGLCVAKAIANLPHLRSSVHSAIEAIAASTVCQAQKITALRDIFEEALDGLDAAATEVLARALAEFNDEQRVGLLVRRLASAGASLREALARLAVAFSACNLDACLGYLQQALAAHSDAPSSSLREAAAAVARACTGRADGSRAESPLSDSGRPRAWDLLELLEATRDVRELPEAAVVLLEWAARPEARPDVTFADRAERILRQSGAPWPAAALDALVRVHASERGDEAKAVEAFEGLAALAEGGARTPTEGSLVGMLSACAPSRNADLAERILDWAMLRSRCTLPVFSAAAKVMIAAKRHDRICEAYEAVEAECGLELDDVCYGQVIRCAVQVGRLALARRLSQKAKNPDAQNTASLIRACGQEGDVRQAMTLLWELHHRGEADTAAFNSALDVAVSGGDRDAARTIFEEMKAARRLDVVSFNILLKQHCGADGSEEESRALLQDMAGCGLRPNVATYNSLLGGALAAGDVPRAWRIIDEMEAGPGLDAYTVSILFKGYKGRRRAMDSQSFDRALTLLDRYSVKVDEVLVNVALEACVGLRDQDRLSAALATFRRCGWSLPKQCAAHTYATLIKAYGMTRQLNMAWKLWGDATARGAPTEQLYSQMIDVLVSNGRLEDALGLFSEMKAAHGKEGLGSQGFAVAYAMIVRGFAQRKECGRAMECYEDMKRQHVKVGLVVFNTLIDACSRVGDMDGAARLFRDMMGADCMPDLITYSTLIKGYCVRGELDQALELFGLMRKKGIRPDAIVFNSLLDGCAKKQSLELCQQVVRAMEDAGVNPSNHSASILIKLYGRCRDLDAAFKVVDEMPRKYGFRPNAAVFTCLMSACIANGRLESAMDLRVRMIRAGEVPDEKTYSTLLRGALRSSSVESLCVLLRAALQEDGPPARHLLDEELVQQALLVLQRRRAWEEHGRELFGRLREAGLQVRAPGVGGAEDSKAPSPAGRCCQQAFSQTQQYRQQERRAQPQRRRAFGGTGNSIGAVM